MGKFFSLDRIRQAAQHLSQFDSKWILPPFVFAANGVSQAGFVDIQSVRGSQEFLDKFFSGSLIGLPKRGKGDSLRPLFAEIGGPLPAGELPKETDVAKHQRTTLWGSSYSRNGYKEMVDRGELLPEGKSRWKLSPTFQAAFETNLPGSFRFEELLVWLFAFQEIPESVNSWQDLWTHFRTLNLEGDDFPAEYKGRFKIQTGTEVVSWPADFLIARPKDADYQKALLPSEFVEPLTLEVWKEINARLVELTKPKFRGLSESRIEQLCDSITSGLIATKRVFLLGDPGVGKSELAKLVADAFEHVVDNERLLSVSVEITDKTTETSLVGFAGIDGFWIDGALTSPHEGKRLLQPTSPTTPDGRGQVNLIVLNEANRQDAEALLSKLQNALDSGAKDAADRSYKIPLGKSGDHSISPYTYILMTGNSPRDDQGRLEQSRPFRRRVALVTVPNPLLEILKSSSKPFLEILQELWEDAAPETAMPAADAKLFKDELANLTNAAVIDCLKQALVMMAEHAGGLSYGLLKKLLVLAGNRVALRGEKVSEALDGAVLIGLTPLLIAAGTYDAKSLGDRLKTLDLVQLPHLKQWCDQQLSSADEFGGVPPGL